MNAIYKPLAAVFSGIGKLLLKLITFLHPVQVIIEDGKAIGQFVPNHLGGMFLPGDPEESNTKPGESGE